MLTDGYVPDADAVHVTQSWLLVRFLRAAGLEILEHRTLPHTTEPTGPRAVLPAGGPDVAVMARAPVRDDLRPHGTSVGPVRPRLPADRGTRAPG